MLADEFMVDSCYGGRDTNTAAIPRVIDGIEGASPSSRLRSRAVVELPYFTLARWARGD